MDPLQQTLNDVLDRMAAAQSQRPAVLFQDQELTCGELRLDADRLADYKVPRAVTILNEFLLTSNGKIQKFRLREVARDE